MMRLPQLFQYTCVHWENARTLAAARGLMEPKHAVVLEVVADALSVRLDFIVTGLPAIPHAHLTLVVLLEHLHLVNAMH